MPTITPSSLQALVSHQDQCFRTIKNQIALRDGRMAAFEEVRKQRFALEDKVQGIRNTVAFMRRAMVDAKDKHAQSQKELRTLDQWTVQVGKHGANRFYREKDGQLRPLQSRSVLRNLLGIGQAARERQRRVLEQRAGTSSGATLSGWLSAQRSALMERMENLQKEQTLEPYFDRLVPQLVRAIGAKHASPLVARLQEPGALRDGLMGLGDAVERLGREPLVRREAELIKERESVEREIARTREDYLQKHDLLLQVRDELTATNLVLSDRLKVCAQTLETLQDRMRVYKTRLSTDSGVGPDEQEELNERVELDQKVASKSELLAKRLVSDQQILSGKLLEVREMLGLLPTL